MDTIPWGEVSLCPLLLGMTFHRATVCFQQVSNACRPAPCASRCATRKRACAAIRTAPQMITTVTSKRMGCAPACGGPRALLSWFLPCDHSFHTSQGACVPVAVSTPQDAMDVPETGGGSIRPRRASLLSPTPHCDNTRHFDKARVVAAMRREGYDILTGEELAHQLGQEIEQDVFSLERRTI